MKLAYLILAHKNPMHLKRLINRLYTENTWFFIHIDSKTVDIDGFLAIPKAISNVFFVSLRVEINWGAYSMIQATLNGLNEIICSGIRFDYIILMSGADYPIKSNEYIFYFFEQHYGQEFIHYREHPIEKFYEGRMDRIWYYYDFDNKYGRFGLPGCFKYENEMKSRNIKRSFIESMEPYHGSQWWALTGDCIKHILDMVNSNKEITNFFRYTKFADEQYFQTLVMNSPYAQNAVSINLWYINWSGGRVHPKTIDIGDIDALKTSDALFARKFDENAQSKLLDVIDKALINYAYI